MPQLTQKPALDEATVKKMMEAEVEQIRLCKCQVSQWLKDGELPDHLANKIESESRLLKQHNAIAIFHHLGVIGTYDGKAKTEDPPLAIEAVFVVNYELKSVEKITD